MIYQGTEVGQIGALGLDGGGRDPHNRQAFPWHERDAWDDDLLSHSREVGQLRNDLYALRRGGLRWCATFDASGVKRNNQKLIAWERAFADPAAAPPGAVCAFHADVERATRARRDGDRGPVAAAAWK